MSFSLRLSWNNGSVPPRYRRSASIDLRPDGTGTVSRRRGYGDGDTAERAFMLDAPEALAVTLRDLGLWRVEWREPERHAVGGGTVTLSATLDGETGAVPAWVVEEQRELKDALVQAVKSAVPEAAMADDR